MTRRPHPADIRDQGVIASAVRFDVALFLGAGHYASRSAPTLPEARREAERIAALHPNGRRPLIYAIDRNGRSALVTVDISTEERGPSMKTYTKKFNAQRAARAAGLKDDEFEIVKVKNGYAYKPKTAEPIVAEKVKLANKSKNELADEISDRLRNSGKRAAIEAAAKSGVLPDPPDFSAPTHARFRNKLARLVELATAGDIDGLKAMTINPVSSSPKAMARYRDLCVIALESRK